MKIPPLPDWRLDPEDDDGPPECPRCDRVLTVATRTYAECGSCGWLNETDYGEDE